MLVIPLPQKISWKNPPIVTILIIFITSWVFFVIQGEDDENYYEAQRFYFESGLAGIELPSYEDYLQQMGSGSNRSAGNREVDEAICREGCEWDSLSTEEQMHLLQVQGVLHQDGQFLQKLRQDEVITPEYENYQEWKELRAQYEEKCSSIVYLQYGFMPLDNRLINALTSLFLHGSFMHLAGNMIFLWLVGCVLEMGCGRVVYILLYLAAGICSAEAHYLADMYSAAPCIGASGAISGLMGVYAVLYGKRKIKIFYSLGFYFSVTRVAAIGLLPFWIGNEIVQYLLQGDTSQIGYWAHVGGFMSGGAMGFAALRVPNLVDETVFEESLPDRVASLLEQAYARTSTLDLADARVLAEKVLTLEPGNRKARTLLGTIDTMIVKSKQ